MLSLQSRDIAVVSPTMCADQSPTFLHAVVAVPCQHGSAIAQSVPDHVF